METLNKVLARILNKNASLKKGVLEARIIELWPDAVGETIAKHARAVQLKNKTLMVEVDHPIWKQELHGNKMLALKKLNEIIKKELFSDAPTADLVEDIFLISTQPKRNEHQNKY